MFTADLAALESVDEEVVLYAAPGADPRLFTAGNASARAAAEAGLVQRIRAVSGEAAHVAAAPELYSPTLCRTLLK